ncbi:hypothetical protein ODJ79_02955 [Actinoplanes sp. KI2]|uniref:hypothetical protein n=1 Tax=Actinoplanes sp. KI2 TaxID=2983315 RepID=UPI0021D5AFC7|nr:hypothetical protein [Actinoplanes sp. KI2]MCU7722664.1 hypothetical protein [Actinoplanes sp. KI2]
MTRVTSSGAPLSWQIARPAPGRSLSGGGLIAVAAVVLLLIVGVVVAVVANGKSPGTGASSADPVAVTTTDPATDPADEPATDPVDESTTDPADEPTTDPTGESTVDPIAQLETYYAQDRSSVSFDGQYAAQIASKYPGITDSLQTTDSGSHTFQAADILAEFERLRDSHGSTDHPVVLLKSTDYGKHQIKDGHFLWVTFALGDFPSAQSVVDWCNAQFGDLTADELADQCAVRRLEP